MMEDAPAVKVETDQQEVDLEQLKVESSHETVITPDDHQTTVKTEPEPMRWIVIQPKEEPEDYMQQGSDYKTQIML